MTSRVADGGPAQGRKPADAQGGSTPLALALLAAVLGANVVLGPLGLGTIQWRVSANGLNQTYGAADRGRSSSLRGGGDR